VLLHWLEDVHRALEIGGLPSDLCGLDLSNGLRIVLSPSICPLAGPKAEEATG
jgi:hypothetical protein